MRAAIRSISSLDVDDLEHWTPKAESWHLDLQLFLGPNDGPGEDIFYLTVCSPQYVAAWVARDAVVEAQHHLIVDSFAWPLVRSFIERRVHACEGHSWEDVAKHLAQFASWEFERYLP